MPMGTMVTKALELSSTHSVLCLCLAKLKTVIYFTQER